MKVSLLMIVVAVIFINAARAQETIREAGYGISNAIFIKTGGTDGYGLSNSISLFNGGGSSDFSVSVSNSFTLNTLLGQSGYGISGAVYINTVLPTVANLSIVRQIEGIQLAWEPVAGATSYKIYRGSDPYEPRLRMLLLGETTDTVWIDSMPDNISKCFYLIITVGQQ